MLPKKAILFIGAGNEAIPGVKYAKKIGYTTIVSDKSYKAPAKKFADYFIKASTYDYKSTLKKALNFNKKIKKIDGAMSLSADVPFTVANVAKKLKLRSIPLKTAKIFSDKYLMKKKFRELGVMIPKFYLIKNLKDLENKIHKFKIAIIKPVDSRGARGVFVVDKTNFKNLFKESMKYSISKKLILEEFLDGEEASYFVIVNNNHFKFFGTAQDHKRVYENDRGPNTGGMGAYSPAPIVTKSLEKKIISKIIKPTLMALSRRKISYNGFLYVGLMVKNNEPYLIEYNIRMGDPECQVILPRLKTDLVQILKNSISNKLKDTIIKWKKHKSMTIVLCSKGYPGSYKKNIKINGLNKINSSKTNFIYHAGTKYVNGEFRSNGGRVLNITSIGSTFFQIRKKIISNLKKINWKKGFYRKDIGWRVISKNENY